MAFSSTGMYAQAGMGAGMAKTRIQEPSKAVGKSGLVVAGRAFRACTAISGAIFLVETASLRVDRASSIV